MKQFLIVLFATGLVVLGYVFTTGSKDDGPDRRRQRPKLQQQGGRTPKRPQADPNRDVKVKTVTTADGQEVEQIVDIPKQQREAADQYLEEATASWRDLVTEDTLVRIEEAWDVETAGIDFDADVLLTLELPNDERLEITQELWRTYLCMTLGDKLLDAELLERVGRQYADEYQTPFGFTDEQWATFFETQANQKGVSVTEFRRQLALNYGLPEQAAEEARRAQIEGILAFYPSVETQAALPKVMQQALDLENDGEYLLMILSQLGEFRRDMDKEEHLAGMANLLEPLAIMFTPVLAEERFRRTWTSFDSELPPGVVMACFLGDVITEQTLPPWLQPDGEPHHVTVDELYPRLDLSNLTPDLRHQYLRELVWMTALPRIQEAQGVALTPEEAWLRHADEFIARSKTALDMKLIVGGYYAYPSMAHYRAVQRVYESHKAALPEGWDSEETQREFYQNHRIFVESWNPMVEAILFSPRRLDGDLSIDWDWAKNEAEKARAQILSGEVEFTALRNRHHTQMKELFAERLGEDVAKDFEESFRMGELGASVRNQQRLFKEEEFAKMINLASVVRNAVVRLDRGEISPVWKTPVGYVLMRVHGAGLAGLEGEFEDYEDLTKYEYERTKFFQWANDALGSVEQVVDN